MANLIAPGLVIYLNDDTAAQIVGVIQQQFFISQVMSGATFDGYVASMPDGYYVISLYQNSQRVLVLRNYQDYTNRTLADFVLYAKNGLISVECNKFGPPGATLSIQRATLAELLMNSKFPQCPYYCRCRCNCCFHNSCCSDCCCNRYYGQFKGEPTNNCDFNPWHLDPPNPEPFND